MVFTRDLNPETLRQMTDGYGRQRRRFQSPEQTEKKKKTRIKMAVGSFLFRDTTSTHLERVSEKYSSEIHYLRYSAGYFYRCSMFSSRKPTGVDDFVFTCCGMVRVYLFKLYRQTYTLDNPTHYKSQEN